MSLDLCDLKRLKITAETRAVSTPGDLAPMHWLMSEFLQDADTKRRAAVDQLSQLMPQIAALLVDAGANGKGKR